jgi:hypothetical protein
MLHKILLFCLGIAAMGSSRAQTLQTSNLPIVVIDTRAQAILEDPKIMARMGIIDNGPGRTNQLTDPFNGYDGWIGIEYRGSSSSWYAKKPYSIELRNPDETDRTEPLLAMPEESDWILISPLNDKTLMRDALSYLYARALGGYAARVRYCELMLNSTYQGVYMLMENIKRDKNRVNISKLNPKDTTGDELTGGYILRIDKYGPPPGYPGGNFQSQYPAVPGGVNRNWFQYHYPKEEDIQPQQSAYIRQYMRSFENMMHGSSFEQEYAKWIDVDSWIDYLLVQEITKNTDAYRLSAYFYKDRDSKGGKLFMGPAWDFNISFGIGDYCEGASYRGWGKDFNIVCGSDGWGVPFWWEKLWQSPAFRKRLAARWQAVRAGGVWSDQRLLRSIDSLETLLQQAQVRNFQRWQVMGTYVWPNAYIGPDYASEVGYLRRWLELRLEWLDEQFFQMGIDPLNPPAPFRFYPTPARDRVFIENDYVPWREQIFYITLYNMQGHAVMEQYFSGTGKVMLDIPAEVRGKGIHYYKIRDQQGRNWSGKMLFL